MKQLLIKTSLVITVLCLIGLGSVRAQAPGRTTVSIESLLREMIDRDSVTRFPATDFRLKQHSSYNRASTTPDDVEGWFNNKDNSTTEKDHNFIRVEEKDGRKEWVLMDHEGPGAIVRTWMPWRGQRKPGTDIEIRIYLDGEDEPVLAGNMLGLLDGTGLIPFPLAHQSLRSAVSFFPIPYARSCKITTTGQPFFYQFTFREYAEDASIESFTMADFEAAKLLTKQVGETLLNPQTSVEGNQLGFSTTLGAKAEKEIALMSGTAAIRDLSVKLGSYDDPTVTRSVVLKIEFDGKQTVWCPIGDFFGSGIGLNPYQGWYRTVDEDGTMSCRWVMPYQNAGKVSLVNLADKPVDAELQVTTADWKWDSSSMYFHSAFRGQYPVATRPYSDWNYVTLKGRGVYVGDTLTIMNPVERWWGEGDEKIWVDGEDFPSIFGTGTEDYYAYSWGGVSTDFYEHPFHAQPRCNVYNKLNRKTSDEKNTKGYSTETRSRSLDTMPFSQSLQLDMEVWSWTDCEMAYGVGTYWYADAETTSNRQPDPDAALQLYPLPDMTVQEPAATPARPRSKLNRKGAAESQFKAKAESNAKTQPRDNQEKRAIEKPNVIIIFADDLGYGDLGCYGATKLQTPNIDQLATEGRRFTDAHSASAVCTPSRYALITGEYPFRKGLSKPVFLKTGLVVDPDRTSVADVMKDAGYTTACIGKWHLGFGEQAPDWNGDLEPGPLELGFDYYYGVPVVNSHPPFVFVENHRVVGLVPDDPFVFGRQAKTRRFPEKMNIDQIGGADAAHTIYDDEAVGTRLTEKSIEWIKANKEKPFFLYLATTNIHHPFTPAPRFKGTSQCGRYGDFVHELDWMVGEVMATLKQEGLDDNTLVIFTSDNGGMFNAGGQDAWKAGHRLNHDLLGFKFGAWEGGHRIPFIARWPGTIPASTTSDQLICSVDLLATMAALVETDISDNEGPDSFNCLPALTGTPTKPIRDHLVLGAFKATHLTIRRGKWLYIGAKGSGGFSGKKGTDFERGGPGAHLLTGQVNSDIESGKLKTDAPAAQLYDLEVDLSQTNNLYRKYPEIAKQLSDFLKECQSSPRTAPHR